MDTCGLGKTNINLGTAFQIQRAKVAKFESETSDTPDEDRVSFYPNIILCPASCIHNTFTECATFFKNLLQPKMYYGQAKDAESFPGMRMAMIPPDGLDT
ncbi:hypothetical protein F5Y05DRAFT_412438 [Hypoxylon sp. FL0543]|nr:hypothetical protein F5Y05DRAFT_412438 [Hypoxylon sp. FL0543]